MVRDAKKLARAMNPTGAVAVVCVIQIVAGIALGIISLLLMAALSELGGSGGMQLLM